MIVSENHTRGELSAFFPVPSEASAQYHGCLPSLSLWDFGMIRACCSYCYVHGVCQALHQGVENVTFELMHSHCARQRFLDNAFMAFIIKIWRFNHHAVVVSAGRQMLASAQRFPCFPITMPSGGGCAAVRHHYTTFPRHVYQYSGQISSPQLTYLFPFCNFLPCTEDLMALVSLYTSIPEEGRFSLKSVWSCQENRVLSSKQPHTGIDSRLRSLMISSPGIKLSEWILTRL